MNKRKVVMIDLATLAILSTRRLLAYKRKLMRCPEGPSWDGAGGPEEIYKTKPEWVAAYEAVKSALATREHIPRRGVKLGKVRKLGRRSK